MLNLIHDAFLVGFGAALFVASLAAGAAVIAAPLWLAWRVLRRGKG